MLFPNYLSLFCNSALRPIKDKCCATGQNTFFLWYRLTECRERLTFAFVWENLT